MIESNAERSKLIAELYNHFIDNTDTFSDGDLAADMAYLFGAIASGGKGIDLTRHSPMHLLLSMLGTNHPVWQYISFFD